MGYSVCSTTERRKELSLPASPRIKRVFLGVLCASDQDGPVGWIMAVQIKMPNARPSPASGTWGSLPAGLDLHKHLPHLLLLPSPEPSLQPRDTLPSTGLPWKDPSGKFLHLSQQSRRMELHSHRRRLLMAGCLLPRLIPSPLPHDAVQSSLK